MTVKMPNVTSVLLDDGQWHTVLNKSFKIDTKCDLTFTTFTFSETVNAVTVTTCGWWSHVKAYRK